jgi:predicted transcriptional regulator
MSDGSKPGPKPKVSDEEILRLFRESVDPVLSTAEVTEEVPLKRRATYDRLVALDEQGKLDSKQIGGRNTVWWLTEMDEE